MANGAKMKNSANTNLLILDEVFDASLDVAGCDEFLKLIHQLVKARMFLSSHTRAIFCQRSFVVRSGLRSIKTLVGLRRQKYEMVSSQSNYGQEAEQLSFDFMRIRHNHTIHYRKCRRCD